MALNCTSAGGERSRPAGATKSTMLPAPDQLYQALASRDRRFEGSFVAGITSTGIYCRPGCPAKLPRPENVRFYQCGAAAEEAGFRACLRCRPDRSPLLPASAGTSATVTRALQLLAQDGAGQGLGPLCEKLGVGPRHLRRLFLQHLGASPQAVLRSQRLRFARALLEESDLPMAELSLAAGFGSLRRFNAEVKRAFQATPGALRKRARGSATKRLHVAADRTAAKASEPRGSARSAGALPPPVELHVAFAPPFDWGALHGFLAARCLPGVESATGGGYARTVLLPGEDGPAPALLQVSRDPRRSALRVSVGPVAPRALPLVAASVQRMFGCGQQPLLVAAHLARDPLLAPVLARHPGLRVPGAWDPFELAVRAVLGQQVSVKGAATLARRLCEAHGAPLPEALRARAAERGLLLERLFPTARALAEAGALRLREIGLPGARAAALHGVALAVHEGRLDFGALAARGLDEAIAALVALPGVGPWTAHYLALRALGEPDAFPHGDLGLLRALRRQRPKATIGDLHARAQAWRPFRATATIALWLADSEGA